MHGVSRSFRWSLMPARSIAITAVVLTLLPSTLDAQRRQPSTPVRNASASAARPAAPVLSPALDSVRASLEKYQDPLAAVRDGFFSTVACIDFPEGGMDGDVRFKPGAMGVHFLNLGNIGPVLDPAKPQVLIYEPVGDKLRLIAAEWFVPAQLVEEGQTPTVLGQRMIGPMDGHEPIMPRELRHYDLHVWLWRDNPNGMFEPTNPKVKCPKAGYTHAEKGVSHAH